jgi:hypothetical protein
VRTAFDNADDRSDALGGVLAILPPGLPIFPALHISRSHFGGPNHRSLYAALDRR